MDEQNSVFWSSTTNIATTDDCLRRVRDYGDDDYYDDEFDYYYYDNEAWSMNFKNGMIERDDKWDLRSVKCVR